MEDKRDHLINIICVITGFHDRKVMGILKDGNIEELILEESTSKHNVGDIVICKVCDLVKNISSAFVDLGGEKAFLPLAADDAIKPGAKPSIKAGDEFPVMIRKEASAGKDMSVSRTLSISGRYAVVTGDPEGGGHVTVSRKIRDDNFRDMVISEYTGYAPGYDITLRTRSYQTPAETVKHEIDELVSSMQEVEDNAGNRTAFSTLYRAGDVFLRSIRDCRFGTVERIITDIPEEYDRMRECFPDMDIRFYEDDMLSLIKLHKLESTLLSAFERVVWLKSGAYLVVDHAEAMTVIDVNSGKNVMNKGKEETFLRINLEAAREIARVLRIRNISGMILVDFINMKKKESRDALALELQKAFEYDPCNAAFIDYTKLGLAEITRKKERPMLRESLRNMEKRLHISLYTK